MLRLTRLLALATATLLLTGCIDTAEWSETLALSDGRVIQLHRSARRQSSGGFVAPRGTPVDQALEVADSSIAWADTFPKRPVSLDVFDSKFYLVLTLGTREDCSQRPPHEYSLRVLRWDGSAWTEVPQDSVPFLAFGANLLRHHWGHSTAEDAKGLIDAKTKMRRDGAPVSMREYLTTTQLLCAKLRQL